MSDLFRANGAVTPADEPPIAYAPPLPEVTDPVAKAGMLLIEEANATSNVGLLKAGHKLVEQSRKPEPEEDEEDFQWKADNADVVIQSQPATAVYRNPFGAVVIRQEAEFPDEDPFIYVMTQNLPALIDTLIDLLPEAIRSNWGR